MGIGQSRVCQIHTKEMKKLKSSLEEYVRGCLLYTSGASQYICPREKGGEKRMNMGTAMKAVGTGWKQSGTTDNGKGRDAGKADFADTFSEMLKAGKKASEWRKQTQNTDVYKRQRHFLLTFFRIIWDLPRQNSRSASIFS